jgi:hypothetical protein
MANNVVNLNLPDTHTTSWQFPNGTIVTINAPADGPPLTIEHGVYCFSSLVHQLHVLASQS